MTLLCKKCGKNLWTFLNYCNIITLMENKSEKEIRRILYKKWHAARDRCRNPENQQYHNYGGRGIKMCVEWENDFHVFYSDMSNSYVLGLTLERVDVHGGYSKENCRWATFIEQAQNKQSSLKNRILSNSKYPSRGVLGKSLSKRFPLTLRGVEYFFDSREQRMCFFKDFHNKITI